MNPEVRSIEGKETGVAMRILMAVIAGCGWFSLVAQLWLILENRVASVMETIVRYFSYFTILTNILVAVAATVLAAQTARRVVAYFSRPPVFAGVAIYITVVGLVYNVILRMLWNPEGLQRIVDELLHSVIPLLFVGSWIAFGRKDGLSWKNVPAWLFFPFVYAIYVLARGAISDFYPYPFLEVGGLGYPRVMLNITGMVAVFVFFSWLALLCSKIAAGKATSHQGDP